MKVIVAVVEEDISHDISKLLAVQKIRCTKISSTGGALRKGNATLIIGVKEEQLDEVLKIFEDTSDNRFKDPDDVTSYNVNVFVMDLKGNFKY